MVLQTVYVICCLFHERSLAVRMMLSRDEVDLCLALGIGQLATQDAQQQKLVVFDEMTRQALEQVAAQKGWSIPDIVARKLLAMRDNESHSERGLDFQVVVAAALFDYKGTVAQFAHDVAEDAGKHDVQLPAWCSRANLRAKAFISLDKAYNVRKFFEFPQKRKGIICQPDNQHRCDGFALIDDPAPDSKNEETSELQTQGGHEEVNEPGKAHAMMVQDAVDDEPRSEVWRSFDETEVFAQWRECQPTSGVMEEIVGSDSAYVLSYSVKLQQAPIGDITRTDDLLSTFLDHAYELKPSTVVKNANQKSQASGEPQASDLDQTSAVEEDINEARRLWVEKAYPKIDAITDGRRLRLHVNIGGYAAYDRKSYENRWPHETGIKDKTVLKKVHVEGEQVRVIIDKTNYHRLFRSSVCQEVIATIIRQNEISHQETQG